MRHILHSLIPFMALVSVWGCSHASSLPQPILEPLIQETGVRYDEARALQACRQEVDASAPLSIQPRWLPPLGGYTDGIVLGTVDAPHPTWASLAVYRHEIERCLVARGYLTTGWR